jgi:hypothetical protein
VIKVEVAKIRVMLGQIPVEIEISEVENGLTPEEIRQLIEAFVESGYTPPVNWSQQNRDANLDKKGTVTSVKAIEGTKMFEVVAKLDDTGQDFKWRVFSATAFRLHDRIIVVKNDRGYKDGQLIDDAEGTQRPLDF